MDIHTATEEAYKNGYTNGYKQGFKEGRESAIQESAHWIQVPSMLGVSGWKVKCSKCNGLENYEQSYCPNCGRKMIISNQITKEG